MELRNHVEWALHCCAILAMLPPESYLATKHLAELHGIPKEYLSKALQALSTAGIVESTLGPTGGYRLAKPPAHVSFLDIVEAVEGRSNTFTCTEIRRNNPCKPKSHRDKTPCAIARTMWQADEAWRATLRQTTLATLAKTLTADIPAETLKKTKDWVTIRT